MLINLVLLVDKNPVALPEWPLGPVFSSTPDVLDLNDLLAQQLPGNKADAWLFWDAALDLPNPSVIEATLAGSGDLWHAGLLLGMRGLPGIIDFVNPTWMLNCDPSPLLEATSWRVSLRACLVRTRVLQKMGFLRMDFLTLEAAALEWGHRCIRRGVVMRHLPALLPGIAGEQPSGVELPFEDQLRFMRYRFGYKWTNWSCLRAALSGFAPWGDIIRASLALRRFTGYQDPSPFRSPGERTALPGDNPAIKDNARVSVVIPTLERYAYLKMLLAQLRTQTQPPAEIIVVDQTPARQRLPKFYDEFKDLPLKLINLDQPGQCSSRNAGLQTTCGEFILFLDDDDEIPPELIAAHLAHLRQSHAAVSSGVANEVGAGPIPEDFTFQRVSDVFPTNNTLIYRSVLERSSLFDLAYERGQRADGDLGMRIYLSGALMMLSPEIQVLHHHAPSGGLRIHKARMVTRASSRMRITHRHLPSVSDLYLGLRYFSPHQVGEAQWLAVFGTFVSNGNKFRKLSKGVYAAMALPHTLWTIFTRQREAKRFMKHFPVIPALNCETK